jgi:hypothetical protein
MKVFIASRGVFVAFRFVNRSTLTPYGAVRCAATSRGSISTRTLLWFTSPITRARR